MSNGILPHDNDALVQGPEAIIPADDEDQRVLSLCHAHGQKQKR